MSEIQDTPLRRRLKMDVIRDIGRAVIAEMRFSVGMQLALLIPRIHSPFETGVNMRISRSKTVWTTFDSLAGRTQTRQRRKRCLRCYSEIRVISGLDLGCENCENADEDPSSFERILALAI